jgi:predicted DNA binding CopG/RHH family protein
MSTGTAAINRKAQAVLAFGSRQITIRLGNDELELARRQAKAKGLKYQTYIKVLLHEALAQSGGGTPANRGLDVFHMSGSV